MKLCCFSHRAYPCGNLLWVFRDWLTPCLLVPLTKSVEMKPRSGILPLLLRSNVVPVRPELTVTYCNLICSVWGINKLADCELFCQDRDLNTKSKHRRLDDVFARTKRSLFVTAPYTSLWHNTGYYTSSRPSTHQTPAKCISVLATR